MDAQEEIGQNLEDRIVAGFLGGVLGDALGEPLEFLPPEERLRRWGPLGVQEFVHSGQRGHFTDDTQMTLFTAEGLMVHASGGEPLLATLHRAYLRWLLTQEFPGRIAPDRYRDEGFLLEAAVLYQRMGPGRTCLVSLSQATDLGVTAVNGSKGCGGLMRVAPIGFWAAMDPEHWDLPRTFGVASGAAQLTHGHACGFLSAGAFAVLLRETAGGTSLEEALRRLLEFLSSLGETGTGVQRPLQTAMELAEARTAWPEAITRLGAGWVAEEILAIVVFLGLAAPDFLAGVRLAANHPGDADSIGAIAGQLLGTLWGMQAIPEDWIRRIDGIGTVHLLVSQFLAASRETRNG